MVAAVVHRDLHIDDREAGQKTLAKSVADPFFDRGNEVARNHAADNLVLELKAGAARERLDAEPAVAVLAATTRLLLQFPLRLGVSFDRFLVWNSRLS